MAQGNWQKYKLLKLLEMLRQETDERHPLSTSKICKDLERRAFRVNVEH